MIAWIDTGEMRDAITVIAEVIAEVIAGLSPGLDPPRDEQGCS